MNLNYRSKASLAATAGLFLAGCGGGGSGIGALTESQIISTGNDLIATYEPLAATLPSNLPTGDTFTYNGVGASSPSASTPSGILATATSIFQVEAEVDFANSTIDGRAFNFYCTQPGCDITGEVRATGTITGSSFVVGNYTGNLQTNGIPSSVTGSISGEFKGPTGEGLIGSGVGTETVSGLGSRTIWTYWGAER